MLPLAYLFEVPVGNVEIANCQLDRESERHGMERQFGVSSYTAGS